MQKIFQLFNQLISYEKVKVHEISVEERLLLLKAIRIRLDKIVQAVDDKTFEYEQVLEKKVQEKESC